MSKTTAGGIIDIESGVIGDTTDTYTILGRTTGEVSWETNVNVAEDDEDHSSKHSDKGATNQGNQISFSGKILSTLGGLEAAGHYDGDAEEEVAHVDVPATSDETRRISVYADEAAKSNEDFLVRLETEDFLSVLETFTLAPSDFHTWEATIHARDTLSVIHQVEETTT